MCGGVLRLALLALPVLTAALVKPAHLRRTSTAEQLRVVPTVRRGGCGKRILTKDLGLKSSMMTSLLQQESHGQADEHPGRESLAKPGVGADQVVADNGRSLTGKVGGAEPYVTVLKDGWFYVGCYKDKMYESGDKYGNGKFKFNTGWSNVSIAKYSEIVLDEKQEKMTPTRCFEFCRTLPGMVFFGISAGRDCYCAPYFTPAPSDSGACDATCEGDPAATCGSTKGGKSSIWQMHLCDDTANDLAEATQAAKLAVEFYFDNAAFSNKLGKIMSESAEKLEEAAGIAGSKTAADNARAANAASGVLSQSYQGGAKVYDKLLAAYEVGDSLEGADFQDAKKQTAAEHAIAVMKPTTGEVLAEGEQVHLANELAYTPVDEVAFGDKPDSTDAAVRVAAPRISDLMKAQEAGDEIGKDEGAGAYRDVPYAMGNTTFKPEASSCSGKAIKAPIVGLGLDGCATVCSEYAGYCKAFSFYSMAEKSDLCVLLEEVYAAEAFSCEGEAQTKGFPAGAKCMVKMAEVATGWAPKAKKLSTYPRCFSTEKGYQVTNSVEKIGLPDATEISVGEGLPMVKAGTPAAKAMKALRF